MATRSDGDIILTRVFERDDGPVRLEYGRPVTDPRPTDADPSDPPWRCDYVIQFPDGSARRSYAVGVDSIQSLLLSIASAAGDLRYVGDRTPTRRPPLRWLGQDDLGLTINHFE